ncbi:hypothetical protein CcCBS67573_g00927 [Chytriomyces confervae]|uniref:BZIP domain-containing protein n=1 Tax=Chytriomyces confervae TaxID=246404 RepID=A0A507FQ16_9FUNG|nr:hypothetical protein HDU80_003596 [Chytriomyces hyalinus]TPX77800.1 hypothetical protein CcCBS67573_g00927 [Chytriomyces confervae]
MASAAVIPPRTASASSRRMVPAPVSVLSPRRTILSVGVMNPGPSTSTAATLSSSSSASTSSSSAVNTSSSTNTPSTANALSSSFTLSASTGLDDPPPPTLAQIVALKNSLLARSISNAGQSPQGRRVTSATGLPSVPVSTPPSTSAASGASTSNRTTSMSTVGGSQSHSEIHSHSEPQDELFDLLFDLSSVDADELLTAATTTASTPSQLRDRRLSHSAPNQADLFGGAHMFLDAKDTQANASLTETFLPDTEEEMQMDVLSSEVDPLSPFADISSDFVDYSSNPFGAWDPLEADPGFALNPMAETFDFSSDEAQQLALDLFGKPSTPNLSGNVNLADINHMLAPSTDMEGVWFGKEGPEDDEAEQDEDQDDLNQALVEKDVPAIPTGVVAPPPAQPVKEKRGRGRPRREPAAVADDAGAVDAPVKRPRGRPRKVVDPNQPIETATKKRKASNSMLPVSHTVTVPVVSAESESVVIPAVLKEEVEDDDEDMNYMMKMAEASLNGTLPKNAVHPPPGPLLPRPLNPSDAAKLSLHKFKPQRPMDSDLAQQYLALKNPNLNSKERRQLRNKLSARSFRERRKEYIDTLEAELCRIVQENVTMSQDLEEARKEREAFKARVEALESTMGKLDLQMSAKLADSDLQKDTAHDEVLKSKASLEQSLPPLRKTEPSIAVHSVLLPEPAVDVLRRPFDFNSVVSERENLVEDWLREQSQFGAVNAFVQEHGEIEMLKLWNHRPGADESLKAAIFDSSIDASTWVAKILGSVRDAVVSTTGQDLSYVREMDSDFLGTAVDINDADTLCGDDSDIQHHDDSTNTQVLNDEAEDLLDEANDDEDKSLCGEEDVHSVGLEAVRMLMRAMNLGSTLPK